VADEPIVRLILDGTGGSRSLDRKPLQFPLLVVLGVRADGQKVMLAIKSWRRKVPRLGVVCRRSDQARLAATGVPHRRWRARAHSAIAAVWGGVPVQRCTVHKHRNLLAHAPERLHEEITAGHNDMIYAETAKRSKWTQGFHSQMADQTPCRGRQP